MIIPRENFKIKTVLLILVAIGLSIFNLHAQNDTTFKPSGKVIVQVINRTLYENSGNTSKYGM